MLPDWINLKLDNSTWQYQLLKQLDEKYNLNDQKIFWENNFPNEKLPKWLTNNNLKSEQIWVNEFLTQGNKKLIRLWLDSGLLRPDTQWLDDLLEKHKNKVARVFILTGNINDYAFDYQKGYMPALDLLSEAVHREGRKVVRYSLSNQFGDEYNQNEDSIEDTDEVFTILNNSGDSANVNGIWDRIQMDFKVMNHLLKETDGTCLVIEYANMLFPSDGRELERNVLQETLLKWALNTSLFKTNNQIILTAESLDSISQNLRSQANKIEITRIKRSETTNERLKFLISLRATNVDKNIEQENLRIGTTFQMPEIPVETDSEFDKLETGLVNVAERASGLNYLGLEDLLLQTKNREKTLSVETITEIKGKLLEEESAGLLEVINSNTTFKDVGGYELIKKRLTNISDSMKGKKTSRLSQLTIPMGILFLGPPGTGKTFLAEAFANECKVNFVKLGDFRSKWVGESEQNLSKVLNLIRSLSPVIVFMDELDQSEGTRGESGSDGVGKRVFSKLLQFMSDTSLRGKVMWIGASNRPDLIDAAMKRAGRFDLSIPFFPPDANTRRTIIEKKLEKLNVSHNLSDKDWAIIAKETPNFTGAELEVIVNESLRRLILENSENDLTIKLADFTKVLNAYRPSRGQDYKKMINKTLLDITFVDTLSENLREKRRILMKKKNLN